MEEIPGTVSAGDPEYTDPDVQIRFAPDGNPSCSGLLLSTVSKPRTIVTKLEEDEKELIS
jgi:hypothetical protein